MPVASWNKKEMKRTAKKVLINLYFRKIAPMKLVESEYRGETLNQGAYPIKLISATKVYTEATTMTVIFMCFARVTAETQ